MSATAVGQAFDGSRAQFEQIVGWLAGEDAAGMTHDELERQLDLQGRELLRRLLPDHLDVRAHQECRLAEVADDCGCATHHHRTERAGSCHRVRAGRGPTAGLPA